MHEINSARGSRSFALASLFLPSSSRTKILELYRWCRKCDDLIDDAPDPEAARSRLRELMQNFAGWEMEPPQWVLPAHTAEFLQGLAMDVEGIRYQSMPELEIYCFRVAGVIGLMMCPLLEAENTEAFGPAVALGKAMQLTNIARDVQADARIGRVYIPGEFLPEADPDVLAREPERARQAVERLLGLADHWYAEGLEGLKWLPIRSAMGIAVAGTVYREIGRKLLRRARLDPVAAFRQRTVVSNFEKVVAVFTAFGILIRVKFLRRPAHLEPKKESASSPAHARR